MKFEQEALKVMPKASILVENDAVAALCSGTDGELSGIVVISGTGSIGFGASSGGAQRFRAGPKPFSGVLPAVMHLLCV